MLAACTPRKPPKCASSACRRFFADTGDLLQRRRRARLRASRPMALDREAVRLVANLLQQVQPRVIGGRSAARGGRERRSPRVPACARALGDADQRRLVQPLLREHLRRDADLPLAAVDHQQIGRRILAGDDPRRSPRDSASRIAA